MDKTKIMIDPGHGGSDPGAIGYDQNAQPIKESNANLNIALILETIFKSHWKNYEVDMTRRTDEFIPLQKRTEKANQAEAFLLSVHCNAVTDPARHGVEVWAFSEFAPAKYQPLRTKDSFGNPGKQEWLVKSYGATWAARTSISIAAETGMPNRGPKFIYDREKGEYTYRKLWVIDKTIKPAILTECGFLSNPDEASGLDIDLDGFNERVALGIFKGAERYFYPEA